MNRILEIWRKRLNEIYQNYHKSNPEPNNIKSVDFEEYTYADRWDKEHSRFMTEVLLTYYGPLNNDLSKDLEAAARIHNGGPDGWRNDPSWFVRNRESTLEEAETKIRKTQEYWRKIKARMEAMK